MTEQSRRPPPIRYFCGIRNFFDSFKEFINYSNSVGLPDRKAFIKFAVERGISPYSWRDTEVYDDFIKHFDASKTPMDLCQISLSTILDLSEIFECDLIEVFEHMHTSDIMKLVIARKLSPWVLLFSTGFMNHIKFEASSEQKDYD